MNNSDTRIWNVINILLFILLTDTIISKIFHFINNQLSFFWWMTLYIIFFIVFNILQYIFIIYAKNKTFDLGIKSKSLLILRSNKIVIVIQSILSIFILFNILQIIVIQEYDTIIINFIISASFGLEVFMLSLLTKRLLFWFKLTNTYTVLLYALSSISLAITGFFTSLYINLLFINLPDKVSITLSGYTATITGNPYYSFFQFTFSISSYISFILMWITTTVLLYHHSKKIGKIRYWLIVALPLIFYFSQFVIANSQISSLLIRLNPFLSVIILKILYSMSLPIGGLFFGTAFWIMARHVGKDSKIGRNYLMLCAYGIIFIFITNQIGISQLNFPPFGIFNAAFIGLASYIMFIGFYSSVISASIDKKILDSIRISAFQKTKFLDSIAEAHRSQEIINDVLAIVNEEEEKIENDTGIESSLSEEETKAYLEEVLLEIKNSNKNKI